MTCHALHLPHQYGFLKRTLPNLRTMPPMAASASSRVAYRRLLQRFLATYEEICCGPQMSSPWAATAGSVMGAWQAKFSQT